MELPQPVMRGLLRKKLGKPSAILPTPERRVGDWPALGRQLAPTFYSRSLGETVCRLAQRHARMRTHMHTQPDTSGESLTYSPNHFIDLWAKDVKVY